MRALNLFFPFVLVALVFIFHTQWAWKDQHYPMDDAGAYAQVAQEAYLITRDYGPATGVFFAYFHRHWKPILNQDLLVPFYFLTNGDTRGAVKIYSLLFSLAFVLTAYAALLKKLQSAGAAFGGALLLNLSPWLLYDQLSFGCELPWLVFSLLAYLCFDRRRLMSMIFLAMALMCRPVESAVLLLPPLIFILLSEIKDLRVRMKQLALTVLEGGVLFSLSLWPYLVRGALAQPREFPLLQQLSIVAGWLGYCGVKFYYLRRGGPSGARSFQRQWTLLLTLVFFWYLPAFYSLWNWVLLTSIGAMAQNAWSTATLQEPFLKLFFKHSGIVIFLPLLAALAMHKNRRRLVKEDYKSFAFALWAGGLLALIGAYTFSRDFRYYQLSWIVIYAFGLALFFRLSTTVVLRRHAYFFLAALVALQAYGTLPFYFAENPWIRNQWPGLIKLSYLTGKAPFIHPLDADEGFIELADSLLKLKLPQNARFSFVDAQNLPAPRPLTNPWKFTLRAREAGRFWEFGSYSFRRGEYGTIEDLIKRATEFVEVLVVGPPNPAHSASDDDTRLSRFLYDCDAGDCEKMGLKQIGSFPIEIGKRREVITFKVFRNERSTAVPRNLLECFRTLIYTL